MSHKPSDSLSLSWFESPAPSAPPSRGHSRAPSQKIDPATMVAAGQRFGNPHEQRGVQIVQQQEGQYRETAKHALFGGGPEKPPNTPKRGVGGNSSMSGILSTPDAVPTQAEAPRSGGRAALGRGTASTLDLSDAPAAGYQQPSTARSFAGVTTKSSISMSSDIDDTPLHTGKGGFNQSRANRNTFQIGGEPEPITSRPTTAATYNRNRSSIQFGDEQPTSRQQPQHMQQQDERQAAGSMTARPTTGARSSDIFFLNPATEEEEEEARRTGRAHIAPATDPAALPAESDGLPNLGIGTSRKNQESGGLFTSYVQPAAASRGYSRADSPQLTMPVGYNPPAAAAGSMIPQLRLGAFSSATSTANTDRPTAGVSTRVPEGPTRDPGHMTRRAYGNVRNASSLFQNDAMTELQPKPQPTQVPDLPQTGKSHLKIVRRGDESQVKNLLVWQ